MFYIKTVKEIVEEVCRLSDCIKLRKEWIESATVDDESKKVYEEEINEMVNDIKRLDWVLG